MTDNYNEDEKKERNNDVVFDEFMEDLMLELDEGPGKYPVR